MRPDTPSFPTIRWIAFAAWLLLPLFVGAALRDVVEHWDTAPAVTLEVTAWCLWAVGVLAFVLGRTRSITALRVVAPIAAGLGVVLGALAHDPTPRWISAIGGVAIAVIALVGPTSRGLTQGDAYGDEVRVPLRVPPALLLAPIPAAITIIAATVVVAPLLFANGRIVVGLVVLAAGLPTSWFALRSIDGTAARVAVFVPAGLTVVDSFTLAVPLHVPRSDVHSVQSRHQFTDRDEGTTADLRVGAPGGIVIVLDTPTSTVVRRGRAAAESVEIDRFEISPVTPHSFLLVAANRRVGRAQDAIAPPNSSSFS